MHEPVAMSKLATGFFVVLWQVANFVLTEYTKLFIILIILLRIKYVAD